MIEKFNSFEKVNESTDYHDIFGVEDAHHLETIERGTVTIYVGEKNYHFRLEMGEGFTDIMLDPDSDGEPKKELEEMGVIFNTKPNYTLFVDDDEFEDFIYDMYEENVN